MRMVELGGTGLVVSEVGFGGIPIQRLTEEEAVQVVHHCLDLGVNLIDTAHGYGTSEERIGRAICGRRRGLVLATKSPGRDAESFRRHLQQSFERLNVEHIDLYQFHNVSTMEDYQRIISPGGPLEVAREAKRQGLIGHIGVTSHKLDVAVELVKTGLFETMMFPFNFISNEAAQQLIPLCRQKSIGFMAMKPMGGGMLEDAGLTFRHLRTFEGVVPVVGIETREQMTEIASIVESGAKLNEADQAAIARTRAELGTRFCRGCEYCQPCSQGIRISMVMRIQSFAKRFPVERLYGEGGRRDVAKVRDCADCGDCESRCPYELPIREIMRQNADWYEEQMALHTSGRR